MELDIRQNNELIMDINSDKERVTVDLADSDVGDSKLTTTLHDDPSNIRHQHRCNRGPWINVPPGRIRDCYMRLP